MKADMIIKNAKIFTSDKDKPMASALAVKGDWPGGLRASRSFFPKAMKCRITPKARSMNCIPRSKSPWGKRFGRKSNLQSDSLLYYILYKNENAFRCDQDMTQGTVPRGTQGMVLFADSS